MAATLGGSRCLERQVLEREGTQEVLGIEDLARPAVFSPASSVPRVGFQMSIVTRDCPFTST
jgi:hypothetical protein